MNEATVVNVRTDEFDVYIGRRMPGAKDPRCRVASPWANPYRVRAGLLREESLTRYEALCRHRLAGKARQLWLGRLHELAGKRLGCWCKPEACHGDVLVKLIGEFCDSSRSRPPGDEAQPVCHEWPHKEGLDGPALPAGGDSVSRSE